MCQLNLYIVKNEVNEKNMIDNLELSLGYGKAEKIVDDDSYSAFIKFSSLKKLSRSWPNKLLKFNFKSLGSYMLFFFFLR